MSYFFGIILMLFAQSTWAAPEALVTVVDMLRETPASVRGVFEMDTSLELYSKNEYLIPIKIKANGREQIGYQFGEDYLNLLTGGAVALTIAGIPVDIKSINYRASDKKFEVRTVTPLIGIGQDALNKKIEDVLNQHYRPKVEAAFNELKKIRTNESLHDVSQVMASITKIFSNGASSPLPNVKGNVELIFNPNRNRKLKFGDWNAEILKDDSIRTGIDFESRGKKFMIKGVEFNSSFGIRLYGKTDFPEIASINFNRLRVDESGSSFFYELGAEETLTGFSLVAGLLTMINGGSTHEVIAGCDPIRLKEIRKTLDANLQNEISKMIRTRRADFLAAGASPQFLAAFD